MPIWLLGVYREREESQHSILVFRKKRKNHKRFSLLLKQWNTIIPYHFKKVVSIIRATEWHISERLGLGGTRDIGFSRNLRRMVRSLNPVDSDKSETVCRLNRYSFQSVVIPFFRFLRAEQKYFLKDLYSCRCKPFCFPCFPTKKLPQLGQPLKSLV